MKSFLLSIFSLVFISVSAFSQQTLSVNQVNNDAEVLAFVKQENYDKTTAPQWSHFYLTDGTEWQSFYNLSQQQIDSVNQNAPTLRWQKADINHDGKLDLIVSGYIARRPKDWATATFKLLVFLSDRGNGSIQMNLIDDQLDKYPAYFNIVTLDDGNSYLQLYRWHTGENNLSDAVPLSADTLKYNTVFDYFVSRTNYLNPASVQRIDYLVQENKNGSYHALSLENIDDKSFPMNISIMQPTYKTPMSYKARLTKMLWNNVDTLVRNIHFASDSMVYNNDTYGNEKLPIKLTIHFSDGTKKTITDYDADASYPLMTMYQVFEQIVNNTLDLYAQRQQQVQQDMDDDWDF